MNTIRFSGMASGMDTQSIVDSLMRAERLPLDRIKQNKQILQWRQEDYRAINTKLTSFRDSLLSMRLQSTYQSKIVTSSNPDRLTATANSTAGNVSYTMQKVTQLATAATNSSAVSISQAGTKLDPTKSLSSQRDAMGTGLLFKSTSSGTGTGVTEELKVETSGNKFKLSTLTNGGEIQFKAAAEPAISVNGVNYTLVTDPNAALGQSDVRLDATTGALTFGKTLAAGDSISISYDYLQKDTLRTGNQSTSTLQLRQQGPVSFENNQIIVRDYTTAADGQITYSNERTLTLRTDGGTLLANEFSVDREGKMTFGEPLAANTEVSAMYSHEYLEAKMTVHQENGPVQKTFKFNAGVTFNSVISQINNSGIGVSMFYDSTMDKVSITRTETGDFNTAGAEMSFTGDAFFENVLKLTNPEQGGTNAKFQLNGLETERTSNNFTINGMTFTLKDTFTEAEGAVTLSSANNTDSAVEAIKKFVNQYNELIGEMNGKLRENVNRDYKPLYDEQRAELSEKEIEKWEKEARSGMLRNDQFLRGAVDGMRSNFYRSVNTGGDFTQLTQIGITTTRNYMEGGRLEINEDKLRTALEQDAESVYQIFASNDGDAPGIANTLRDTITTAVTSITEHAGNGMRPNASFTMGRSINDMDKRISDFERRLQTTEDRYWTQFTAFETAMQRQNDQLNFMMGQLGMAPQQ
ncbi:flagellar filament capping protein FliD [Jeotgalibacillus soli]|uniref:Flagellar hook-associated protein 2 n=1 Tax=Jeotgalibacillus soli TaxID=889306 RepID=A0A0C2RIF8_9BACL|nr:flagellar filament capping protein FliD [Jeotgalibacillus soli]KIL49945.1 hypothetical protein KP78_14130 [Jeotgalibacillus soli]